MTVATETGAATTSPEPFEGRLAREAARSHGAALFAEHGTLIQRICRHLLRDEFEAEDAAQQTFLSAYKALLGGADPRDGEAWLATIARNECLQRIRARMRQPLPVHEAGLADRGPDVHQLAVNNVNAAQLWREINRLPQHQRDAVILREISGLSYQELGALLGVTRPAVESLLFRARAQLRDRLRAALASLNLVGLASEGAAAVARLVGAGAAPLAVKTAAVGVGVAVVGGGGVVAERRLELHPAAAAQARVHVLPTRQVRARARPVPVASHRPPAIPLAAVDRRAHRLDAGGRGGVHAEKAEAVETEDHAQANARGEDHDSSGRRSESHLTEGVSSASLPATTAASATTTTTSRDSGTSPDPHEGSGRDGSESTVNSVASSSDGPSSGGAQPTEGESGSGKAAVAENAGSGDRGGEQESGSAFTTSSTTTTTTTTTTQVTTSGDGHGGSGHDDGGGSGSH